MARNSSWVTAMSTGVASLVLLLTFGVKTSAQQAAPVTKPVTVVSLHRASADWAVHTTFQLKGQAAGQDATTFDFTIVQGSPTPNGALVNCQEGGLPPPLPGAGQSGTTTVKNAVLATCVYEPPIGFSGKEELTYTATDTKAKATSARTPITIDVRKQGLRWEVLTGASTGLTSDTATPSDIPGMLGGTNADVLFALNWQTMNAREKNDSITGQAERANLINVPKPSGQLTRKLNVLFKLGWVSDEASVNATPVAPVTPAPPSSNTSPAAPAGATPIAATQRHFTSSGQVDFSFVGLADSSGTFIEVGGTGQGGIEVYPENSEQVKNVNGALLQLMNGGRTTLAYEAGVRFALKQYAENPNSRALKGDQVVHLENIEDLLQFEAGYQRDNAMEGLPAEKGDSRDRLFMRVTAYLPLPHAPGRPKPALGLELNRPKGGGSWTTRIVYGVNLSGNSLFGLKQ